MLSDFEVNKTLAIAVGHKCYYDNRTYTNDGKNVVVKGNGVLGWFDPCNNWNEIGPLIHKLGISLIKMEDEYIAVGPDWDYIDIRNYDIDSPCIGADAAVTSDTNPLRAASLCAIAILEKQKS